MDPTCFLQPGSPNIVHEDFGDEMVVVNLESGRYYTFNPSGGELWLEIGRRCSFQALLESTLSRHEGDPLQIEQALASFVNRLAEETLVGMLPNPHGMNDSGAIATFSADHKTPFIPPAFESYTDMQDLLLLDPIHEVDKTGWPHPNPDGKPAAKE